MPRNIVWIALSVQLCCTGNAIAQELVKVLVGWKSVDRQLAAQATPQLCRELMATVTTKGTLLGHTLRGEAIIEAAPNDVSALLRSPDVVVSPTITAEIRPVSALLLHYTHGKKPTAVDLEALGLQLKEDYEKGAFLIVTPLKPINGEMAAAIAKHNTIVKAAINYAGFFVDPPIKLGRARLSSPSGMLPAPTSGIADPFYVNGSLWGLNAIRVHSLWQQLELAEPVIVAVIDSGTDYSHEDLKDNMWQNSRELVNGRDDDGNGLIDDVIGYDFVDNDPNPSDPFGHGTHVAGTIAASRNAVGVIGTNWRTKIMALRFLDAQGNNGMDDNAIKCIDYAIDNGADVINFSAVCEGGEHDGFQAAIERARDAGVLVVASAGNRSMDLDVGIPHYPASFPVENVISVAAMSRDGSLSDLSNYGKTTVDLAAPGGSKNGPREDDIVSCFPGNRYQYMCGTSMAAPHVTAALAGMLGSHHYREAAPDRRARSLMVKSDLLQNAKRQVNLAGKCVHGALDLAFLDEAVASVAVGTVGHAKFKHGEREARGISPTPLAVTRILLDREMEVHVRADTTVSCSSVSVTKFIVAFATKFPPKDWADQEWAESQRVLTIASTNESKLVSTTYATVLPAGEHQIHWFVGDIKSGRQLAPGATLMFGAGCMTVEAFPIATPDVHP